MSKQNKFLFILTNREMEF